MLAFDPQQLGALVVACCAAAFLAGCASNQQAPGTLPVAKSTLSAQWKVGTEYHYSASWVRHFDLPPEANTKLSEDMRHAMNNELHGDVVVRVTSKTSTTYDLHWQATVADNEQMGSGSSVGAIAEAMQRYKVGMPLELTVDVAGEHASLRVRNLPAVRHHMFLKARELLGNKASLMDCADEKPDSKCPLVRGTDDQLGFLVLRAASPLFACTGLQFDYNQPRQWTEQHDMPNGEAELPVRYLVRVVDSDRQAATVHVRVQTEPDADAVRALLTRSIGSDNTKGLRSALQTTTYREEADCLMSTRDGWPLSVEDTERAMMSGYEGSETIRFKRGSDR